METLSAPAPRERGSAPRLPPSRRCTAARNSAARACSVAQQPASASYDSKQRTVDRDKTKETTTPQTDRRDGDRGGVRYCVSAAL